MPWEAMIAKSAVLRMSIQRNLRMPGVNSMLLFSAYLAIPFPRMLLHKKAHPGRIRMSLQT